MELAELEKRLGYLLPQQLERVRLAYALARDLHSAQTRNSGEPYITHPTAVAGLCAQWKLDHQAICAALLHDTLEDCSITKAQLAAQFGQTVAHLVDGLTKLEKIPEVSRSENQAESFRKMLLAMASDVRVVLIKLADRTHNMRTLGHSPRQKWARIARETQDIYAPIAHRLGLNQVYCELQDLSLKYAKPWRYEVVQRAVEQARTRAHDLLSKGQRDLEAAFANAKISAQIRGREKSPASVYQKMKRRHINFADVNDLFAFRIIVPSLNDCYTAIGVLHQLYKPVPGKFKDYIALPKGNSYQSLHTMLVAPSGVRIEFQVRTQAMHGVAENGVAAHWLYKAANGSSDAKRTGGHPPLNEASQALEPRWLESLLDIQSQTQDASEFWEHVRVDLVPEAVYVFTPQDKILALPRGATPVDFAYAVHTSLGDRCISAKVNGELVALGSPLHNGDRVEVITSPSASPDPSWLSFVRTGRARSHIRHYLKTQASAKAVSSGEHLLISSLRQQGYADLPMPTDSLWQRLLQFSANKTVTELFSDLGLGKRVAVVLAKHLAKLFHESGQTPDPMLLSSSLLQDPQLLLIDSTNNPTIVMADCCHPMAGDSITGYMGHGEGLIIHRSDCVIAQRLQQKNPERLMRAQWADDGVGGGLESTRRFTAPVSVVTHEGPGVLAKVSQAITKSDANIVGIQMGPVVDTAQWPERASAQRPITTELRFMLSVRDTAHLQATLDALDRLDVVVSAQRITAQRAVSR